MNSDQKNNITWAVCAEGLDVDHRNDWLTVVDLLLCSPPREQKRQKPISILRAVIRQTDDDRNITQIQINRCLTNDDATVILLAVFDLLRIYDLGECPQSVTVDLAEWLKPLYDDPARATVIFNQLSHCAAIHTQKDRRH